MLSSEALKKVKKIEMTTRRLVEDMMSGGFRSSFKGHGVQFSEHRVYLPGDDVRHIDWKVSARTKEPLIKKFEEERELTVLLVVDISGSQNFSSSAKLKSEILAEIGGMISYAATRTGDKVGLILFADKIVKMLPPKKGRSHVLRIIREILTSETLPGSNLKDALSAADRLLKQSSVVFVLSDFICSDYERELKKLSRRHDVSAFWLTDQREREVPDLGTLYLWDPEAKEAVYVQSNSYVFRSWLNQNDQKRKQKTEEAFRGGGVEFVKLGTQDNAPDQVVRFFKQRRSRQARKVR